jgi:hypothetical protein
MSTSWVRPGIVGLAVLLSATALIGCPAPPASSTCLTIRDCGASQTCLAGRCVASTADASSDDAEVVADGGEGEDASDPASDAAGPSGDGGALTSDAGIDSGAIPDAGSCGPMAGVRCGGECVDPTTDERYCGDCDTACAIGSTCWESDCGFRELLYLINVARSSPRMCGTTLMPAVPALIWSDPLEAASLRHALDMAAHRDPVFPGSDGSSPETRAEAEGFPRARLLSWGIIQMGYAERLPDVVDMLLESPTRCANVMAPTAQLFGAAAADAPPAEIYWMYYFGRAP